MDLAVWRDISLMWLIVLTFVALVPFGVLFFFAVKGMHRLRQLAKRYLPIAQKKARLVPTTADRLSRKLAAPAIAAGARAAQVRAIGRAIFRRNPS